VATVASNLPLGLMVLIADDDERIAQLWRSILSAAGPSLCAVTASDGGEAIRLAHELQPDVILMDLVMPNVDGIAATRALKADLSTSRIPIVAVTGAMYESQRVLEAGCDGYMIKPLAAEDLVRALRSALRLGDPQA
jgi:CheY-like chemotaxis protein